MQFPPNKLLYIAVFGALTMVGALGYGFVYGDFSAEGEVLTNLPWGIVSLIDIYVGLIIFSCWVFWRETNMLAAATWTLALLLTGNLATCIYIVFAFLQAKSNSQIFWHGKTAHSNPE